MSALNHTWEVVKRPGEPAKIIVPETGESVAVIVYDDHEEEYARHICDVHNVFIGINVSMNNDSPDLTLCDGCKCASWCIVTPKEDRCKELRMCAGYSA